jgi:hypothetical protein
VFLLVEINQSLVQQQCKSMQWNGQDFSRE